MGTPSLWKSVGTFRSSLIVVRCGLLVPRSRQHEVVARHLEALLDDGRSALGVPGPDTGPDGGPAVVGRVGLLDDVGAVDVVAEAQGELLHPIGF